MAIERDQPEYYHLTGKIFLQKGQIKEASADLDESIKRSRETHNIQYELSSLAEMARIAVLERDTGKYDHFHSELEQILSNDDKKGFKLPIALLQRCLGDLSLLDNQFEQAVKWYKEAFPIIAESGRYNPYTITGQLHDIQKNVLKYYKEKEEGNLKKIRNLASQLIDFWTEEDKPLDVEHPEALIEFGYWKSGDINRWG